MGKFKELHIELQQQRKQQRNKEVADMLCMQYPTLYYFIQQAFDLGDEDKVYDLIFALETEYPPC